MVSVDVAVVPRPTLRDHRLLAHTFCGGGRVTGSTWVCEISLVTTVVSKLIGFKKDFI